MSSLPENINEAFPNTTLLKTPTEKGQLLTEVAVAWHKKTFQAYLLQIFSFTQWTMTQNSERAFFEWSKTAVTDVLQLKKEQPDLKPLCDLLQFRIGSMAMAQARLNKQNSKLWRWSIRSLHDGEISYVTNWKPFDRILGLREVNSTFLQAEASKAMKLWLIPFFYAARHLGISFFDLAAWICPLTIGIGYQILDNPLPSEDPEHGFELLSEVLSWDAEANDTRKFPEVFTEIYDRYKNGYFEPGIAQSAGYMFATRVGETAGLDIENEARLVLQRFSASLALGAKLQILISANFGKNQCFIQSSEELLKGITEYRARFLKQIDADTEYESGRVFAHLSKVYPMIAKANDFTLAQKIIAEWMGLDSSEMIKKLLLVLPHADVGVGYFSQEIFVSNDLDNEEVNARHRALLNASNLALSDRHQLLHAQDFELPQIVSGRNDIPNPLGAKAFEDSLRMSFVLADRSKHKEHLEANEAFAIIPYQNYPLQALFLKELGTSLPQSVSFEIPAQDRDLKKVCIIYDSSSSASVEVAEVAAILEGQDICVTKKGIYARSDADEFLDIYASAEFDVLWLIGHGEFDADYPEDASLILGDQIAIKASELTSPPKNGRRRLLFLNVCSGGKGAVLGGLPAFGIGTSLASSEQAVISNLWPVDPKFAAYFGIMLAKALVDCYSFFEAYEKTVLKMIGIESTDRSNLENLGVNPDSITRLLGGEETNPLEVLDGASRNHPWSNILHWGAPVFLQ